jgi:hypothetical protein
MKAQHVGRNPGSSGLQTSRPFFQLVKAHRAERKTLWATAESRPVFGRARLKREDATCEGRPQGAPEVQISSTQEHIASREFVELFVLLIFRKPS